MNYDERYKQLKEKVTEDYNDIVRNANFLDGDVEELSLKIAVAGAFTSYISTELEYCTSDIDALLNYERPTSSFYENFTEKGSDLLRGLIEQIDSFIIETKQKYPQLEKDDVDYGEEFDDDMER